MENGLVSPSRKRRAASMLYEAMLLFGVVFIAGYLFDTLTQSRHALTLRHERQLWYFFVIGFYFVWFWTHGGQTLAMKTWHLKVVTEDGKPIGVVTAMLRYLLCWPLTLSGLGFVYSFFDKNGQFPQDRLLKTLLVSSKPTARGKESVLKQGSNDLPSKA